jgi:predicted ATPase
LGGVVLKKISLVNFKSFKNLDGMDIKNITIIVGKNSCGKSSILQSLLLLKQTIESPSDAELCLEGRYIKCSNIKELAYGVPQVNYAKIGYKLSFDNYSVELFFKNKRTEDGYIPIVASYKIFNSSGGVVEFKRSISTPEFDKIFRKKINLLSSAEEVTFREVIYNKFTPVSVKVDLLEQSIAQTLTMPIAFAYNDEIKIAQKLVKEIENIKYLSPIRAIPERAYVHYSEASSELNTDGSNAAHILWSKRNSNVLWRGEKIPLKDAVNECIKCMGLGQELSPDRIGDVLYKIGIKELVSGSNISLADVGFGYSQIIPVILLGLINSSKNLMLIEQPEIHLHPSSAANLADLFLAFAQDDKKFIIETHSQELINRLRLRVIENPELKEMINIVCVESDEQAGAQIQQFQIDENGMFPAWPDGFLDESEKLAYAIIQARINKVSKKQSTFNESLIKCKE